MNRQNHSEPESRLTQEEKQEFLELLAQLSLEQRKALKEVLKSFMQAEAVCGHIHQMLSGCPKDPFHPD